jgi:hypothetical protein
MAKPLATLLLGLSLAFGPACGRKGPLVLPAGRAPLPVEGLSAVAGEGTVVLKWTNPVKAVSGRPLGPLKAVEIWVFEAGSPSGDRPLTSGEVERTARLAGTIPRREFGARSEASLESVGGMTFAYAVAPPPDAEAPLRLAFTVRVIDRAGRASDFAAPVAVEIARKAGGVDRTAREGVS